MSCAAFLDGAAGYYTVLGLHARGLVEWGVGILPSGMRAMSESSRHHSAYQDTTALNAICDMLFLSGRSREGLRLLREISAERGPSKANQQLDTAMACARAMYYIDIGSTDLAEHQIDLMADAVSSMSLGELSRLSCALWRSRHVAMLVAQNDTRSRHASGQGLEVSTLMHEAALAHSERNASMWTKVWCKWSDFASRKEQRAASRGCKESDLDCSELDSEESGLNFGPGHAALATLVFGALPMDTDFDGESNNTQSNTHSSASGTD